MDGDLLYHIVRLSLERELRIIRNDIGIVRDGHSAVLDQGVRALRIGRCDIAHHRENVAILLERPARRDQRTAFLSRFHDENAVGQSRNDTVALGKGELARRIIGRVFGDHRAAFGDRLAHHDIAHQVREVDPAAEHADGHAACFQRRVMTDTVDTESAAADDDDADLRERPRQHVRGHLAVCGRVARTDDGDT